MKPSADHCPACGSHRMIEGAEFPDAWDAMQSRDSRIRVAARPDAKIFKERAESKLRADVCGECGFVQLFALQPEKLWDAYRRSQAEE